MQTLREYLRAARVWLAAQAERLHGWLHPSYTTASVTTRRLQRFHNLLIDVGVDDLHERVAQRVEQEQFGPVQLMQQKDALEPDVREEDIAEVARALFEGDRLEELNRITLNIRPSEAGDVPRQVAEEALASFTIAYALHIRALLSMRSAIAST